MFPFYNSWNFCIAVIPNPILGADFLAHFQLVPVLHESRLVDTSTSLGVADFWKNTPVFGISSIGRSTIFFNILSDFLEITNVTQDSKPQVQGVEHHIFTNGPPVAERARRLSSEKLAIAKTEFQVMLDLGICRPSSSPWASPFHMAPKKDGTWRIYGDYRRLNAVTVPEKYPVPHLHNFTANLNGMTKFSTLDLYKAYNQIPVADHDIPKTAVITPFGLFEYPMINIGLHNAGQTFQRYIFQALGDLDFVFAYIDDVLVSSADLEKHKEHFRVVFQRLKNYGLRLNLSNCQWDKSQLEFLGYTINSEGSKPTLEKVQAILKFPKPRTIVELRRFLGLVNFDRRNLPHAAETQAPLNQFLHDTRKNDKREITWSLEARWVR